MLHYFEKELNMGKKVTDSKDNMLLSAQRVKECREEKSLSQEELIQKIELLPENRGKHRNEKHLSAIECGKRTLSIEYARLISKVLMVREEYLLGYDDFKTGSAQTKSQIQKWGNKHQCIKYLIEDMGYHEEYYSQTRYKSISISSEDTEQIIQKKIAFVKKSLATMPDYDMTISDKSGRKIHLCSSEISRIYDDIEFYIKYRLEKEFDDISHYVRIEDMGKSLPDTN